MAISSYLLAHNVLLTFGAKWFCSHLKKYIYIASHGVIRYDIVFFCLMAIFCFLPPFSLPHGNIKFSSTAVAFDWCFLPSRRCQTTDMSNTEALLLLSSSPAAILPASRPSSHGAAFYWHSSLDLGSLPRLPSRQGIPIPSSPLAICPF